MRTSPRLLIAALLGFSVLAPTAAHAEKRTFADVRGDGQAFTVTATDPGADDYEESPTRPSRTEAGDVLRTALSNTGNRISVRLRLADISRRVTSAYVFTFAGSNGRRFEGFVDNTFAVEGESSLERPGRGDDVRVCERSVRHRIDYRAGTVSLSFPRSCVGSPQRIRVAAVSTWTRPRGDDALDAFYDIAGRDGGDVGRRRDFSGAVRHTR